MSKRTPTLLIEDSLDSAERIVEYTSGMTLGISPWTIRQLMQLSETLKSLAKHPTYFLITSKKPVRT